MKKGFLITLGLLFTLLTFGQQFFLRTDAVSARGGAGQTWSEWQELNILIHFNLDDEVITVDNAFADKFYIRSWSEPASVEAEDGDIFNTVYMKAIDKDGVECELFYATHDTNETKIFVAIYSNIEYRYRCAKID